MHKHCRPVEGLFQRLQISSTLEPIGCLCFKPEGFRCSSNGGRLEIGAFDKNVHGFFCYLCITATHHACNCNRSFSVPDKESFPGDFAFRAIKGCKLHIRLSSCDLGRTDPYQMAFDCAEIESMQRMTEFEQNVIRNIYDIVDGSNSALFKPLLHPVGR